MPFVEHTWCTKKHTRNRLKWSKVKSLSRVRLFATPLTAACQDPQSMGFSRQEYWSGLPFPSPDYTVFNVALPNKRWILNSLFTWENWASERLKDLPKVIQIKVVKQRLRPVESDTQAQGLCSKLYCPLPLKRLTKSIEGVRGGRERELRLIRFQVTDNLSPQLFQHWEDTWTPKKKEKEKKQQLKRKGMGQCSGISFPALCLLGDCLLAGM